MKMFRVASIILISAITLFAQNINVNSVKPAQNLIGAERHSQVKVFINKSIGVVQYNENQLFKIYGSNSGLVKGIVAIDSIDNSFAFIPDRPFFCGEIINASFGPLISEADTLRSFNWRFTIEITNPTVAKFDSLALYNYPSFDAIAIDYDKDGHIDVVSGTGRVLYNDGKGSFIRSEQIVELYDAKYITDVNNDGIVDIITAGKYSDEVAVYFGDETGKYSKSQVLYPYNKSGGIIIAVGDVNGDGYSDLISKESYNGQFNHIWRKFINDGTGTFIRDTNTTYLEQYITQAQLVDMNNDGYLDLILLRTYDLNSNPDLIGTHIYYNNGKGGFDRHEIWRSLRDLAQIFIIDYDKNGLNDVAGFGSVEGGDVLLQEPPGVYNVYLDRTYFSSGENFAFFTSGDVNGDNRFDMIVSNLQACRECEDSAEVTFRIELNSPDLLFGDYKAKKGYKLGQRKDVGSAVVPIMADVDNDGDLDIIHTGYPTTVTFNKNIPTSMNNHDEIPNYLELFQNYPNPFNPKTTIAFRLPRENFVKLIVYDILGREVQVLVNENKSAGYYKVDFDASSLTSGVYFYRVIYNNNVLTKKMQIVK